MNKICIYHGNCADGFTAAWVVRKALGDIEFHKGIYGTPPPDVRDKDVYIVDFSYDRQTMQDIIQHAAKVVHIDHHTTAIEAVGDLMGMEVCYSRENAASGAMLCWQYFFPNEEPPQLIKHIDDRDRWQFKIPNTKEIQAAVFSYAYTFENWDYLMSLDVSKLIADGEAIQRKHFKDIYELRQSMSRRMNIGGYDVPVMNLPYTHSSEAGHIMAINEPFAACYYDTALGREFSLRSSKEGIDVSAIARLYGGGGHFHAAGFRVTNEEATRMENNSELSNKSRSKGIKGVYRKFIQWLRVFLDDVRSLW